MLFYGRFLRSSRRNPHAIFQPAHPTSRPAREGHYANNDLNIYCKWAIVGLQSGTCPLANLDYRLSREPRNIINAHFRKCVPMSKFYTLHGDVVRLPVNPGWLVWASFPRYEDYESFPRFVGNVDTFLHVKPCSTKTR